MTGSDPHGLAQHFDGIAPSPKLPIGHAKKAERVDMAGVVTKDPGIGRHRIGDRAPAVQQHRLLEEKIDR